MMLQQASSSKPFATFASRHSDKLATLFLTVSRDTTQEYLWKTLGRRYSIESIRLRQNKCNQHQSVVVTFPSHRAASHALNDLKGKRWNGFALNPRWDQTTETTKLVLQNHVHERAMRPTVIFFSVPATTTNTQVQHLCQSFGPIARVSLQRQSNGRQSTLVQFDHHHHALQAKESLFGWKQDGLAIYPKWARMHQQHPEMTTIKDKPSSPLANQQQQHICWNNTLPELNDENFNAGARSCLMHLDLNSL